MARCSTGKTCAKALSAFPKYEEVINTLKPQCCQVLAEFPYAPYRYGMEEEDYFSALVVLCLDKCCGHSRTPLGEWMDFGNREDE